MLWAIRWVEVGAESEHEEDCAIRLEEGGTSFGVLLPVEVYPLSLNVPLRLGALRRAGASLWDTRDWCDHLSLVHDDFGVWLGVAGGARCVVPRGVVPGSGHRGSRQSVGLSLGGR